MFGLKKLLLYTIWLSITVWPNLLQPHNAAETLSSNVAEIPMSADVLHSFIYLDWTNCVWQVKSQEGRGAQSVLQNGLGQPGRCRVCSCVCMSSWQLLCLLSACGIPEPPHTLLCPAFLWSTSVTGESVGKTEASGPKMHRWKQWKGRIKREEKNKWQGELTLSSRKEVIVCRNWRDNKLLPFIF